jgi:hypothetical protein
MKKLQLVALCIVLGTTLFAQKPADFSGTWTLKDRKSLSGQDYANGVPGKVTFKSNKDSIYITRAIGDQTGQLVPSDESVSLSKPTESITATKKKRVTTLSWDKQSNSMMLNSSFNLPESINETTFKVTEKWTLSADNKKLTLVKNFENVKDTNDKWSMEGYYEKE